MNRARAKGSAFAKAVAVYLSENGFPYCERRVDGGSRDRGDISGLPGVCIEAKATRDIDLAGAVDEAAREAANDGASVAVAVIKRKNRPVGRAYAVVELETMVRLLREREGL